jgi:transposase-like protein
MRCYGWGVKRDRNGKMTDGSGERARWVKQYRASGQGLKQFAQRHGLKPGQLHYWVYQSPQIPGTLEALPTFQEVRLPPTALTSGSWSTEIGLPNGTTVRLARQTDLAWAMALIDSLRRPCS